MTCPAVLRCAALLAPLALAACSGGGNSLLGGGTPETAASLVSNPVNDPKTRAVQVAWNVSRAQKCGFNLDNATLKQNYLAYETAQGMTADRLPSVEKAFEFSRIETADRIGKIADYCSKKRVDETRADLGRYLAGDFAARKVKKDAPAASNAVSDFFDGGDSSTQVTAEEAIKTKE